MLREAVASGSDFGKKVSNILDTGGLVSDEIIGELIKNRLTQSDCINGSLFDGVPRTLGQAAELKNMGINFTHVIEIQVDEEVIVKRMSGRRVHPGSGKNYHIDFNPPQIEGKDDETGEPLIQREDDKPETVLKTTFDNLNTEFDSTLDELARVQQINIDLQGQISSLTSTNQTLQGQIDALNILIEQLRNFSIIQFGWDVIVRSGLVRDYIMTKEMLEVD